MCRSRSVSGSPRPSGTVISRPASRATFFSGNPNSQQQVYELAQQKIQTAAQQSPLLAQAQKNTVAMLDGMLTSLGFRHVTVTFGSAPAS